jgi:hypothetical protein
MINQKNLKVLSILSVLFVALLSCSSSKVEKQDEGHYETDFVDFNEYEVESASGTSYSITFPSEVYLNNDRLGEELNYGGSDFVFTLGCTYSASESEYLPCIKDDQSVDNASEVPVTSGVDLAYKVGDITFQTEDDKFVFSGDSEVELSIAYKGNVLISIVMDRSELKSIANSNNVDINIGEDVIQADYEDMKMARKALNIQSDL